MCHTTCLVPPAGQVALSEPRKHLVGHSRVGHRAVSGVRLLSGRSPQKAAQRPAVSVVSAVSGHLGRRHLGSQPPEAPHRAVTQGHRVRPIIGTSPVLVGRTVARRCIARTTRDHPVSFTLKLRWCWLRGESPDLSGGSRNERSCCISQEFAHAAATPPAHIGVRVSRPCVLGSPCRLAGAAAARPPSIPQVTATFIAMRSDIIASARGTPPVPWSRSRSRRGRKTKSATGKRHLGRTVGTEHQRNPEEPVRHIDRSSPANGRRMRYAVFDCMILASGPGVHAGNHGE